MKYNLNVKHLFCPMSVIRLSEMIKKIKINDTIEILTTDTGVLHDISAWCKVHGHQVILVNQKTNEIIIFVEKTG
ncbi:sulfurtransferase TusA family protein [Candidatus Vesicomyidisocius calyptogenae]|uniref:UPF0033 domain-containing protein n=1 Tax=Vesicomyosocius okutanii subsp. Calyptogena okutanii (strain HA) TaxID=412965 RepID=A5CWV8_VESOH|nr:sulfurtransferase TusA family protein [Candidatus Vesicomyosocius okutanii]BAF61576.1 conserved hypothetical protein [Candidatus Vesicomyosocius okutanii]